MAQADTAVAERAHFLRDPIAADRIAGRGFSMLGALWMVYGVLRIAVAALLIVYSGTATVMFGALLTRVANPYTLMDFFHFLYLAAILLGIVAAVASLIAGWMLMARSTSQRGFALAAALLSVSDIPFGTTLGAYTLAVFAPRV
jgi:hypothetical protein